MSKPNHTLAGPTAIVSAFSLLAAAIAVGAILVYGDLSRQVEQTKQPTASQSAEAAKTEATRASDVTNETTLVDVTPPTPWKTIPDDATLTRIGIGSCLHQGHPQPIWEAIIGAKPDLFLMLGDNVYGDIRKGDPNELGRTYIAQGRQPEFAAARQAFPFLATWDDHDYGQNDGGAGYRFQPQAANFFRQFWSAPEAKRPDGGIYYAQTIGPAGKRVQFIMLDTRSFRSPLKRKSASFPHWGKYEPDADPTKTILGAEQWSWLRTQLEAPADIRIIASSVQVLANGHGYERWGNLPAEKARLEALIAETGATGVLFVSGDRHSGALFKQPLTRTDGTTAAQPNLVEITASSLNRSYGPSKDDRMPPLLGEIYHQENFGVIEIDWAARTLVVGLRGMGGDVLEETTIPFAEIGISG